MNLSITINPYLYTVYLTYFIRCVVLLTQYHNIFKEQNVHVNDFF